ncbi:hypothetical protein Hte_009825 [Hypoxylon texense]
MASTIPTSSPALAPSAEPSPIQSLPLHVVSMILSKFRTVPELLPVIQSHSIFYHALHDNVHSICRTIVLKQIPGNALPFLIENLKATPTRSDNGGGDSEALDMMAYVTAKASKHTIQTATILPHPASLSFADYVFLSRHYAHSIQLARGLQRGVMTIFLQQFEIDHEDPSKEQENLLPLMRSFFRQRRYFNDEVSFFHWYDDSVTAKWVHFPDLFT